MQIQQKNDTIRRHKDDMRVLRGHAGLNQVIKNMNEITDAADELEELSSQKWKGLNAMDKML